MLSQRHCIVWITQPSTDLVLHHGKQNYWTIGLLDYRTKLLDYRTNPVLHHGKQNYWTCKTRLNGRFPRPKSRGVWENGNRQSVPCHTAKIPTSWNLLFVHDICVHVLCPRYLCAFAVLRWQGSQANVLLWEWRKKTPKGFPGVWLRTSLMLLDRDRESLV